MEFRFINALLDVRVEDEAGTFYNVEVQKAPETDFVERMLFGWAETYGSQLLRGKKYDALCPVREEKDVRKETLRLLKI